MRWCCVFFVVLCLVLGLPALPQTLAASRVVVYDFLAAAQHATWTGWEPTTNHPLTFGTQSFTDGFAMSFSGTLEDGLSYSSAVETYVPATSPSGITGDYYHIYVPAQAQLELIYGFKQGTSGTDGVEVGVAYAEDHPSLPVSELLKQSKTYDGALGKVNIDLSPYAGKVAGLQLFVRSGATATADALVWVQAVMTVPQPQPGQPSVVTYDFRTEAYNAKWSGWESGGAQPLTFDVAATTKGFVGAFNGLVEDGKSYANTLQTIPPASANSGLTGDYRNLYIPAGAQLRIKFGFQKGLSATDGVTAGIGYFAAGVANMELAVNKTYDNALKEATQDLSSYSGNFAGFQLFIRAGASATDDGLVWLAAVLEIPSEVPSIQPTVLQFHINDPTYYVNGVTKTMDTAPVIVESRTFLPIRFVVEALGAKVDWSAPDQKVTITFGGKKIELWISKNEAIVNGILSVMIDSGNPKVAPFIQPPGRTMMPLRFITESLGCKVEWFPDLNQEVQVTYPAS